MQDAVVIEKDDDKECEEHEANPDPDTDATLSWGGRTSLLLGRVGEILRARPTGIRRFGHCCLQFSNQHTPIFDSAYFF
jgi:hypothetical protein